MRPPPPHQLSLVFALTNSCSLWLSLTYPCQCPGPSSYSPTVSVYQGGPHNHPGLELDCDQPDSIVIKQWKEGEQDSEEKMGSLIGSDGRGYVITNWDNHRWEYERRKEEQRKKRGDRNQFVMFRRSQGWRGEERGRRSSGVEGRDGKWCHKMKRERERELKRKEVQSDLTFLLLFSPIIFFTLLNSPSLSSSSLLSLLLHCYVPGTASRVWLRFDYLQW